MGRKKKRRKNQKATPASSAPKKTTQASISQTNEAGPPAAMHGLDKRLTVLAFAALVLVALFVPPMLGQKLTQEYQRFSQATLTALAQGDVKALHAGMIPEFQAKYSPSELENWLKEKQLYQVGPLTAQWEQRQRRNAVMRARSEQGLLTALFAAPPNLSFDNTWQLVNLCHSEQELRQTAQRFLGYLHEANFTLAYTLSAENVIEQKNNVAQWQLKFEKQNWPKAASWQWRKLEVDEQGALILSAVSQASEGKTQKLTSLWLEQAESCAYLVKELNIENLTESP